MLSLFLRLGGGALAFRLDDLSLKPAAEDNKERRIMIKRPQNAHF